MFSARKLLKTSNLFNPNILKLILLLLVSSSTANAQTGYYQPFSVGVGYGATIAFAGEQTLTSSNSTEFNLNYQFTPFVAVSIEGQYGNLSGGNATEDTFGKQFLNNYTAVILHADLQLGELMDYSHSRFLNGLKNIYGGIGVGMLSNKIASINTVNPATPGTPLTYIAKSSNILIPLRVGYEFKIFSRYDEPQFRFDINYSLNTAFGNGLDGYTNKFSKAYPIKFYNYLSVGVKYSFGPVRPYRKLIYYTDF